MLRRLLRFFLYFLLSLLILLLAFGVWVWSVRDIAPPAIADESPLSWNRETADSGAYRLNRSWLLQNRYGLYEMYVEGEPFAMGVTYGRLANELLFAQEKAFTDEIRRMVPNPSYLKFLRYLVGFMNRNLPEHVSREYQEEIYGIAQSASDEFAWIGTPYSRQLNYHAAHDIGHALANMMLVGCSSFAVWQQASADSQLLIGRNFDFYVGDEFARRKIIALYKPAKGHPFLSVTWGGFTGVVSGMNKEGLTVTINAAKSAIPFGAATPVSLVAREILQYASNLEEALAIAHRRKMFVSESFLVGSAKDKRAIVIEKTPDTLDVYAPLGGELLCTNHYQSPLLSEQELNKEQMQNSASVYRRKRLEELMARYRPLHPAAAAAILRDHRGLSDADIGLGNEKAMNQFIAHHAVIFQPEQRKVWVSTSPWQEGPMLCYDLNRIFDDSVPAAVPQFADPETIPADPFLQTPEFAKFSRYRELKAKAKLGETISPLEMVLSNPLLYDACILAGDQYVKQGKKDSARLMYAQALRREVATEGERASVMEKLKALDKD